MDYGFDLNSYVDNLADDYGVFDDVADSLDFAGVGISTVNPELDDQKTGEGNKKNNNKTIKLVNSSLRDADNVESLATLEEHALAFKSKGTY